MFVVQSLKVMNLFVNPVWERMLKMTGEEKRGKRVYPIWRLDKNISWHNFFTYPSGIIYGLLVLEWLRPSRKFMVWRLKPWKIWLPPTYSKNYKELF